MKIRKSKTQDLKRTSVINLRRKKPKKVQQMIEVNEEDERSYMMIIRVKCLVWNLAMQWMLH